MDSPSTHRIVKDLLNKMQGADCVDFYYDLLTVVEIAKKNMDYNLGK